MSIISIRVGGTNLHVSDQHDWSDVSSEAVRVYQFSAGRLVIAEPGLLAVSESGGHRIVTLDGLFVYVPPEWLAVVSAPRTGHAHCSF